MVFTDSFTAVSTVFLLLSPLHSPSYPCQHLIDTLPSLLSPIPIIIITTIATATGITAPGAITDVERGAVANQINLAVLSLRAFSKCLIRMSEIPSNLPQCWKHCRLQIDLTTPSSDNYEGGAITFQSKCLLFRSCIYNGGSGHSHAFYSSFNDCDSYLVLYYVIAFTSLLVFFEWIFSDVTLLCNHRKRNISSQKSALFYFEKCCAFCAIVPTTTASYNIDIIYLSTSSSSHGWLEIIFLASWFIKFCCNIIRFLYRSISKEGNISDECTIAC